MNRKCFRESTQPAPAFLLIHRARPGMPRESRGHLLQLGQGLVATCSRLCACPLFWCYKVAQSQGALVILSVPNPICWMTLGKSLPFSGPYFSLR